MAIKFWLNGNHDYSRGENYWKELGFKKVYNKGLYTIENWKNFPELEKNGNFSENEQDFDFLKKVPFENGSTIGFSEGQKSDKITVLPTRKFDYIVFSHYPVQTDINVLNIHGHIHNAPLGEEFNPQNHFCASVEMINYTPILLEEILRKKNQN